MTMVEHHSAEGLQALFREEREARGTFNQWNSVGARIRKGEKGSTAVLYKPVIKSDVNEAGEEVKSQFSLLKSFSLFNLEQVEGDDLDHLRPAETSVANSADYFKAQSVIDATESRCGHVLPRCDSEV